MQVPEGWWKWSGRVSRETTPKTPWALFKQMGQAAIAAPGFRLQPRGILGTGSHLVANRIPEARKQVIVATYSRILTFHPLPNPVISSPFEFSLWWLESSHSLSSFYCRLSRYLPSSMLDHSNSPQTALYFISWAVSSHLNENSPGARTWTFALMSTFSAL